MAAASLATLRSKIEGDLCGRVPAPFTYRDRHIFELVSTGLPEIDALAGGLPRGAMTEICGAPCSGRASFLLSALASRTNDGEACALVDARDSFDPATAQAAGITLPQLLWVRCHDIDQALRATDLLIQSGGFGLVAIDLSDVPPKTVRQVPLNVWFRFRRAVEDTPTILLLLEQESNAKTCASLVLRMDTQHAHGSETTESQETSPQGLQTVCISGFSLGGRVFQPRRKASHINKALAPLAKLLGGYEVRSEVVRSRIQLQSNKRVINIRDAQSAPAQFTIFKTQTMWSDFSNAPQR
jgi:recombination protein RecA